MSDKSHPNRKSWFNLLFGSKPNRFGRILILFFLVVAVQAVVCLEIFRSTISQIQLLDTPKPDAAVDIMFQLTNLGWFFAITIVALCAVCMYLIYHITVNVTGAKQAVLLYIQQLKSGDYTQFRKLRGDDDFKDVMLALDDLAGRLKEKEKS